MCFCLLFDNIESVGIVKSLQLFSLLVELFYEIKCLPYCDNFVGLEISLSEVIMPFEVISYSEGCYDILVFA